MTASERIAPRYPSWLPWLVLLAGAALRLFRLGDWSLWEDEETSNYFALNSGRPFPRSFPLYFFLLGRLYALTGVSVYAGRGLSALIGIFTLWLAYRCIRRFCGDHVALPALVLLVVSPGHLFWSQSIRYYGLVLAFQIASIHAFLNALERPSIRWWSLTIGWLLVAIATHTTAAILIPVYLIAVAWRIATGTIGWRRSRGVLVLGIVTVAIACGALMTLAWLRPMFERPPAAFPLNLFIKFACYAGVPAIALMFLALILWRRASSSFVFFALLATVPLAELVVIRATSVWYVVWYHGFVAIVGVAAMAGYGWNELAQRAPRWALTSVGLAAVGASALIIVSYFTTAYGDRPRWREAATVLSRNSVGPMVTGTNIVANSPGVIAYYLGVPAGQTMGHPLVTTASWPRALEWMTRDTWFVLETRRLPPDASSWLSTNCELRTTLPARMVIRDRTVVVYHCPAR